MDGIDLTGERGVGSSSLLTKNRISYDCRVGMIKIHDNYFSRFKISAGYLRCYPDLVRYILRRLIKLKFYIGAKIFIETELFIY